MFEQLLAQLKEMTKLLLADDEIHDLTAQTLKKQFDALVRAGFTPEQATAIVASKGGVGASK